MLAIKDKKEAVAIDVKAKARMNKYPATGIDVEYYDCYSAFSKKYNMQFWVIFVDEETNEIYGDTLEHLDIPIIHDGMSYPLIIATRFGKNLRLWPIYRMVKFGSVPLEHRDELKKHSTRNYEFEEAPPNNSIENKNSM